MKKQYTSHIENLESRQLLNADALPIECPKMLVMDCASEFAEERQLFATKIQGLETAIQTLETENAILKRTPWDTISETLNSGAEKANAAWDRLNSQDIGTAIGQTLLKTFGNAIVPALGLATVYKFDFITGKNTAIAGAVMGATALKSTVAETGYGITLFEEMGYPAAAVTAFKYGPGAIKWTQGAMMSVGAAVKATGYTVKNWISDHTPSLFKRAGEDTTPPSTPTPGSPIKTPPSLSSFPEIGGTTPVFASASGETTPTFASTASASESGFTNLID